MNGPEVTLDEGLKFQTWLKNFGLELITTVIDNHIYLVDIREEYTSGRYRYFSQRGSSKILVEPKERPMPEIVISKDFTFEASHVLPKHEGKCARLHGHSWQLRISVIGPVDPYNGFVLDYAKLKRLVTDQVIDKLDHTHLGYGEAKHITVVGSLATTPEPLFGWKFYPSSENLVVAIANILQPLIPELNANVRLFEVHLKETCTSEARYRPYYASAEPSGY